MRKFIAAGLASLIGFSAGVGAAHAQTRHYDPARHEYYYYYHHHRYACHRAKRRAANEGTALGAVTGGVAGALLGHGVVGGLVGAGVGAVGGHEIAKSTVHC